MSHEITSTDKQQGLTIAWHKLTEVVQKIILATCWLAQWDVRKRPLFRKLSDGSMHETESCEMVATDNESIVIGNPVHCTSYSPITNADFLRIIQETIDGISGATVESVGSVCGRGRVFVSVKLAELPIFKAAGREFVPYLNFLNSHDQSAPFCVNTSNICTVCNNTFGANLGATGFNKRSNKGFGLKAARESLTARRVRVMLKHTRYVNDRLSQVSDLVDSFLGAQAEFQLAMDKLNSVALPAANVRPLFTGFIVSPDLPRDLSKASKSDMELSTRRENQIGRLVELHNSGLGNRGQTLADAFSAVTDYFTHESSGDVAAEKQFAASEFGAGLQHKQRAYDLFQDTDSVAELVTVGRAVLAVN